MKVSNMIIECLNIDLLIIIFCIKIFFGHFFYFIKHESAKERDGKLSFLKMILLT